MHFRVIALLAVCFFAQAGPVLPRNLTSHPRWLTNRATEFRAPRPAISR